jgi:ubiquinone/menaquinone biosynthesis C-methylase UbiE
VGGMGSIWRHVAVTRPYDGLAAAWSTATSLVYEPLAVSLVHASPIDLAGKLVLDLGSGTGTVAHALAANGARVVVADCSLGMVLHGHQHGWTAIVADALALPVRDGCFDAVIAGFLLNHVAPSVALTEMARAVRSGGVVVASTWASARSDPVKVAIGDVLASWGWRPPAWYETMKAEVEPISGDPRRLSDAAGQAGLVDVHATVVAEDLGLHDSSVVVAYRLAMPQIAPWVARLGEPATSELVRQLCAAVVPHVPGWRPSVIQLTARVPVPVQPR